MRGRSRERYKRKYIGGEAETISLSSPALRPVFPPVSRAVSLCSGQSAGLSPTLQLRGRLSWPGCLHSPDTAPIHQLLTRHYTNTPVTHKTLHQYTSYSTDTTTIHELLNRPSTDTLVLHQTFDKYTPHTKPIQLAFAISLPLHSYTRHTQGTNKPYPLLIRNYTKLLAMHLTCHWYKPGITLIHLAFTKQFT